MSIGSILGSAIKTFGGSMLSSMTGVGPAASILQSVAGSLFNGSSFGDTIKNAAQAGIASALPGPAGALVNSGVDMISNLFGGQASGNNFSLPGVTDRSTSGLFSTATNAISNFLGGGSSIQGSGASEVLNTGSVFSSGPSFEQMKADFKAKGLKDEDASMMALQEQQQRYNRMLTLITQLLQMKHEGLKGIVQNLRA